MSKIVTVFNEKGGCGKTTVACHLAGTFGLRGLDVLVADLDAQQTSAAWLAAREGANIKATIWPGFRYGASITGEIQKLSSKYDLIIADCAPSVENVTTWAMLLVSDLIIIPTRLSPPDIAALHAAKRLARRAIEESGRNDITVRVLANAARMHLNDARMYFDNLAKDREFPVLKTVLGERMSFSRAMLLGATAHALRGVEAIQEIDGLASEVAALLHLPAKFRKAA